MFDITNYQSFKTAMGYIKEIAKRFEQSLPIIILIANKTDLEHERNVSEEEIQVCSN